MIAEDELREIVNAIESGRSCHLRVNSGKRTHALPGSMANTIRREKGVTEATQRSWGFPAAWNGRTVFNTRIESALGGSAMWRNAFRHGRCIIPAAKFFEPHEAERALSPRTGKPVKRPYEFEDETGLPLLMAGVADDRFCSVMTTDANESVTPVHPRMPLILRFEEVPLWLEGSASDIAALADRSQLYLAARPELEAIRTTQTNPNEGQLSLF